MFTKIHTALLKPGLAIPTTVSLIVLQCQTLWAVTCVPWFSYCTQQAQMAAVSIVAATWVRSCRGCSGRCDSLLSTFYCRSCARPSANQVFRNQSCDGILIIGVKCTSDCMPGAVWEYFLHMRWCSLLSYLYFTPAPCTDRSRWYTHLPIGQDMFWLHQGDWKILCA